MRITTRTLGATLLCSLLATAVRAAEPDRLALARQALGVLETNCYHCHGKDGTNEGGFNYVLDAAKLVGRKKVVPGDAGRSKLYRRLVSTSDPMPPEDEKVRPAKDDVALLKQWIDAGAPAAVAPAARRAFVSAADVVRAMHDDLTGPVPERDRRFTRYFTLTHLYNAGLSDDELQSYRHGLAKLVNSLSWGRRVVVPHPIDEARTVFRIDLRDYQWNEKVWDTILDVNPYGVLPLTDAARECAVLTRCRLPFVRGDWFVAAASRPPLYHDVLQLPSTEQELERMLRVDVAEDVRLERVARAGFNSSGVSRNNRLIERHEAGAVTYWKSYDFASNTGRQNLFAHPLGPGDDAEFRHDGGEIIFNLPNGLQGYMLVTGAGKRLDKGPTSIVSDPRRPDRAVENGLSCMSCHAKGLIEKTDQVRDAVRKNAAAFSAADADTVLALYPPREKFAELLRGDARRFQEAVAATGAPLTATEPVVALALRFEAELDLSLAAAEAGVRPEDLAKALDGSPLLAKQLGSLRVEGGTVQRQVFVDAFGDLAEVLRVGEFLAPRNKALAQWIMQGDGLLAKGDAAGAVRAYTEALALDPRSTQALNNRGLARSSRDEQDAAIADFTEAIRLDPNLAVAYHNRGSANFRKGDLERALADYDDAVRLEPRSARFRNNRGLVHFERGDHDKALADYDEALRLEPKFAVAFNNRGLAYSRKGDYDRAIADFTEAIRLEAKFARAYHNRGVAHEKKGDAERAEADRKKAVQLDPSLEKE